MVLVVEKKRKNTKTETRIYDEVPHPIDNNSHKSNEQNQELYENMHAHSNVGFVDELNDIIKKNVQNSPKTSPKRAIVTDTKLQKVQIVKECDPNTVAKTESIEANMDVEDACENDNFYQDREPLKSVAKDLEKSYATAEENIYVNHDATLDCDTDITEHISKEDVTNRNSKQDTLERNRYSPQIDLEKAQEIYENAAFPVKYSRIATPRICERSHQASKKGKPPTRKGYQETVQPVLQKLERPKISIRRNPSVLSETELIYDDVPDETAEDDESGETKPDAPVKPPIKPKPRLSKIMKNKNKNKTPSPKLKSVDDTIMIDNEVYTATS